MQKAAGYEREATGRAWRRIRHRIMSRDCGLCQACQRAGKLALATEVDHKLPVWDGGTDEEHNLEALCAPCHRVKTAAEATERAG